MTDFKFIEGEDYYYDGNRKMVLTEAYLMRRGKCCGSGCKNCPFDPAHTKGNTKLKDKKNLEN